MDGVASYSDPTTGKSAPMYYPVRDKAGNVVLLSTLRTFEHRGITYTLRNAERIEGENWVEAYARNPGAPLDPSDVVWPSHAMQTRWCDGSVLQWPTDEWGRGRSVLEVQRITRARKVAA